VLKKHVDGLQAVFGPQSPRPSETGSPRKLVVDTFAEKLSAVGLPMVQMALDEVMTECNALERTVAHPQNGPVCDIIQHMLDFVPGAVPFSYFLAILAFGEQRYLQATRAIRNVLGSRWGFNASQCHMLLAQIRLQMKQYDDAESELGREVSYDFQIRN
jgi:tetratricopeptide repeat protein 21B